MHGQINLIKLLKHGDILYHVSYIIYYISMVESNRFDNAYSKI